MEFLQGTEEYYKKFIELQEKLRKSEEERLNLEMKYNDMMEVAREEEHQYYRKLKNQYKQFLEENHLRHERNERIFRLMERIESRAAVLEAKTERFNFLRRQYYVHLKRREAPIEAKHETPTDPNIILNKYLQDLKPEYKFENQSSLVDDILKTIHTKKSEEKAFNSHDYGVGDGARRGREPEGKYSNGYGYSNHSGDYDGKMEEGYNLKNYENIGGYGSTTNRDGRREEGYDLKNYKNSGDNKYSNLRNGAGSEEFIAQNKYSEDTKPRFDNFDSRNDQKIHQDSDYYHRKEDDASKQEFQSVGFANDPKFEDIGHKTIKKDLSKEKLPTQYDFDLNSKINNDISILNVEIYQGNQDSSLITNSNTPEINQVLQETHVEDQTNNLEKEDQSQYTFDKKQMVPNQNGNTYSDQNQTNSDQPTYDQNLVQNQSGYNPNQVENLNTNDQNIISQAKNLGKIDLNETTYNQNQINYDQNQASYVENYYDDNGQPIPYDEHGSRIYYDEEGRAFTYQDNEVKDYNKFDENGQLVQYDQTGKILQYEVQGQQVNYDQNEGINEEVVSASLHDNNVIGVSQDTGLSGQESFPEQNIAENAHVTAFEQSPENKMSKNWKQLVTGARNLPNYQDQYLQPQTNPQGNLPIQEINYDQTDPQNYAQPDQEIQYDVGGVHQDKVLEGQESLSDQNIVENAQVGAYEQNPENKLSKNWKQLVTGARNLPNYQDQYLQPQINPQGNQDQTNSQNYDQPPDETQYQANPETYDQGNYDPVSNVDQVYNPNIADQAYDANNVQAANENTDQVYPNNEQAYDATNDQAYNDSNNVEGYDRNNDPAYEVSNDQAYDANNEQQPFDPSTNQNYDEAYNNQQDDSSNQLTYDPNSQDQQYQYDESGRAFYYDENGQAVYYEQDQAGYEQNAYYQEGENAYYTDQTGGEYAEKQGDQSVGHQNVVDENSGHDSTEINNGPPSGEVFMDTSDVSVSQGVEENVAGDVKKSNVINLLETDSESTQKEPTKVSNDSDFDFSNNA